MNLRLRSKLGFSLVELMIVVAIIGVLATIGVPTFRTMVQKAKKSEAKVALGGLYTAEAAFNSEYGVYGNAIDRIGFDLDGQDTTRQYATGFFGADCGTPQSTIKPILASAPALNTAFPGYFNGAAQVYLINSKNKIAGGSTTSAASCATTAVADAGTTFTAGSAGQISTKWAENDVWTINQDRTLANVFDGTK